MLRLLVASIISLALPLTALAAEPCGPSDPSAVSTGDLARIEAIAQSRLRGLAGALGSDSAEDRATLAGLYVNGLAGVGDVGSGEYACRTIKLGGNLPLVVYGFFDCTITSGPDGPTIEKTTGSQRFSGTLTRSGENYFYRGALHYSDEGPMAYDGASERDQVGCLYRVSADGESLVLELPHPVFESLHDVIVLVPRD